LHSKQKVNVKIPFVTSIHYVPAVTKLGHCWHFNPETQAGENRGTADSSREMTLGG
jgi:hypothetical protein